MFKNIKTYYQAFYDNFDYMDPIDLGAVIAMLIMSAITTIAGLYGVIMLFIKFSISGLIMTLLLLLVGVPLLCCSILIIIDFFERINQDFYHMKWYQLKHDIPDKVYKIPQIKPNYKRKDDFE